MTPEESHVYRKKIFKCDTRGAPQGATSGYLQHVVPMGLVQYLVFIVFATNILSLRDYYHSLFLYRNCSA